MATIQLPNEWRPRAYQRPLWRYMENGGKRAAAVWHRRAGKDDVALHWTACAAFERVANYWHMLPQFNQARRAIWEAVNPHTGKKRIDEAFPLELRKRTNHHEMFIEFLNGSTWRVVGSDSFDALVGAGPAGIVFSEWSLCDPRAWPILAPMLEENGGWAFFIYTARGRNHGWSLADMARKRDDWFAEILPATETEVFTNEQLEGIESEYEALFPGHGESLYRQEYLCDFTAPVLGAYYGKQISEAEQQGRITTVPYDPSQPVQTAWDLGIGDATAIWLWQMCANEIHVIGYHENTSQPLKYYVDWLDKWGGEHSAEWGYDWLPQDAKARSLETGRTRVETLKSMGRKPRVVAPHKIMDGINAVRVSFPRIWIDDGCERGLECLRQYRAEYDEGKLTYKDQPLHDWASHGCFKGDTEVLTRYGMCRIMDLPAIGEVLTPCGWKHYHSPRITKKSARLVEVRFTDGYSVKCTPDHLFLTASGWKSAESLRTGTQIRSGSIQSPHTLTAGCTDDGRAIGTGHAAARNYTEMFGRALSALSQRVATFTTGMETLTTISYQTLSAYPRANTFQCPGGSGKSPMKAGLRRKRDGKPLTGMGRKRGGCGTAVTLNALRAGLSGGESRESVWSVARRLIASFAKAATRRNIVRQNASPLIIENVRPLSETADVWDITVPDGHWFSLANGAVVHNSDAFRYLAMAWHEMRGTVPAERGRTMQTLTLNDLWSQTQKGRQRI